MLLKFLLRKKSENLLTVDNGKPSPKNKAAQEDNGSDAKEDDET